MQGSHPSINMSEAWTLSKHTSVFAAELQVYNFDQYGFRGGTQPFGGILCQLFLLSITWKRRSCGVTDPITPLTAKAVIHVC
jgi:hypothetical protein